MASKYAVDLLETPELTANVPQVKLPTANPFRTPNTPKLKRGSSDSANRALGGSSSSSSRPAPPRHNLYQRPGSSSLLATTPSLSSASLSYTPGKETPLGREVQRGGVTPRTGSTTGSTTPHLTNATKSFMLVALVEGRGIAHGEVGMASLDLKNPELELSQFADTISYSKTLKKLQLKGPVEIIFPHTACDNGNMSKFFKLVGESVQGCSLTTIQRRYFNDSKGTQQIRCLCHKNFTNAIFEVSEKWSRNVVHFLLGLEIFKMQFTNHNLVTEYPPHLIKESHSSHVRYYALAACAALLKYLEFIQNMVYAPGALKLVFSGSVQSMMIDVTSVRNLELIENSRDQSSTGTLLTAMNFTGTFGGARLLRANILQPPCDLATISLRQSAVSELIARPDLPAFHHLLRRFLSLDHVLSLCIQLPRQSTVKSAENKVTQIIYLKHVVELVPPLKNFLRDCETPVFKAYAKILEDPSFDEIKEMISSLIHDDIHYQKGLLQMRTQKCFAVKEGLSIALDIARKLYAEQVNAVSEVVQALGQEHSLPLRVAYNSLRGFHIQMTASQTARHHLSLPQVFIKINRWKNTVSCTSIDLVKLK